MAGWNGEWVRVLFRKEMTGLGKLGRGCCSVCLLMLVGAMGCSRARRSEPQSASSTQAPADPGAIPTGAAGALIFRGKVIFDHTPQYARPWAGNALACSDCHLKSGTQAWAAPMYGVARDYPSFSGRAGRVITIEERLQECMVRSEDGQPPPVDNDVMKALVAYINWLSRDEFKTQAATGRGYGAIADLKGSVVRGKNLYAKKCAGCHGIAGVANPAILAPLWGPGSWNDGAGIDRAAELAAFLLRNMPADKPGTLAAQEAMDVAAYVDSRPRPKFDRKYEKY
jgi:thiosulfate dehydrogenase